MFKVGDIVRALPKSDGYYGITNYEQRCMGRVIRVNSYTIEIKIIDHNYKSEIGERYTVYPEHFELAINKNFLKFVEETLNLERK